MKTTKFYHKENRFYTYLLIDYINKEYNSFGLNTCIDGIELKYNHIHRIIDGLDQSGFSRNEKLMK